MEKSRTIGIVITTFNRSVDIVYRALKSILNQTYQNFEVIVVDDNFANNEYSDKIKEMIDNLNCVQVKYLKNGKNLGACSSRNRGASLLSTEFIAFLDDDDEWSINKLEKMLPYFEIENIGLVFSSVIIFKEKMNVKEILNFYESDFTGNIFEQLLSANVIGSTSYPLLRKSLFDAVGGFLVDFSALQDWELWLRIANICNVHYIKEPLTIYHSHVGERISLNTLNRLKSIEYLYMKYEKYYESNQLIHAKFIMNVVNLCMDAKKYDKGLEYLLKIKKISINYVFENLIPYCKMLLICIKNK
ncbi:MAG: glycosyltransferase family 2 protein [Bacilli bacterium]|uniref:glycosyltransferase family 2 protein n=1 Tax=Anaerorhabdus sp. TaxID=1872524 RepID=UPI002FC60E9C